MTHCRLAERGRLFNGHIGNQNRIDAHARTLGVKFINATVKHQVSIHQQANRNGRVLLADRCQHLKTLRWRDASRKGAQGGVLNGRAICQRV